MEMCFPRANTENKYKEVMKTSKTRSVIIYQSKPSTEFTFEVKLPLLLVSDTGVDNDNVLKT